MFVNIIKIPIIFKWAENIEVIKFTTEKYPIRDTTCVTDTFTDASDIWHFDTGPSCVFNFGVRHQLNNLFCYSLTLSTKDSNNPANAICMLPGIYKELTKPTTNFELLMSHQGHVNL